MSKLGVFIRGAQNAGTVIDNCEKFFKDIESETTILGMSKFFDGLEVIFNSESGISELLKKKYLINGDGAYTIHSLDTALTLQKAFPAKEEEFKQSVRRQIERRCSVQVLDVVKVPFSKERPTIGSGKWTILLDVPEVEVLDVFKKMGLPDNMTLDDPENGNRCRVTFHCRTCQLDEHIQFQCPGGPILKANNPSKASVSNESSAGSSYQETRGIPNEGKPQKVPVSSKSSHGSSFQEPRPYADTLKAGNPPKLKVSHSSLAERSYQEPKAMAPNPPQVSYSNTISPGSNSQTPKATSPIISFEEHEWTKSSSKKVQRIAQTSSVSVEPIPKADESQKEPVFNTSPPGCSSDVLVVELNSEEDESYVLSTEEVDRSIRMPENVEELEAFVKKHRFVPDYSVIKNIFSIDRPEKPSSVKRPAEHDTEPIDIPPWKMPISNPVKHYEDTNDESTTPTLYPGPFFPEKEKDHTDVLSGKQLRAFVSHAAMKKYPAQFALAKYTSDVDGLFRQLTALKTRYYRKPKSSFSKDAKFISQVENILKNFYNKSTKGSQRERNINVINEIASNEIYNVSSNPTE